jgi:hypothetical protein
MQRPVVQSAYFNKELPYRQKLVLALSGLLHKSAVGLESARQLIELLAKDDEEKYSRVGTVEETYNKDPASVSGKRWFLNVLAHAANNDTDIARSILDKLFRIIGVAKDIVAQATKTIMNEHHFLTIEESKEILVYQNGVYVPDGDIIIEKEADAIFGYELATRDITEITKYIMRKTYHKREELDANLELINVKNGLYNWATDKIQ